MAKLCVGCVLTDLPSEEETSNSAVSPDESKNLGRIRVSYRRIKYGKRRDFTPTSRGTERVSEVSEKIFKGKSIDNTIEYVTPS